MTQKEIKCWAWNQLQYMSTDSPKLTLLFLANKSWGETEFSYPLAKLSQDRGVAERTISRSLSQHPLKKLVTYTPGRGGVDSHFVLNVGVDLGTLKATRSQGTLIKVNTSSIVDDWEEHWKELRSPNPKLASRNNSSESKTLFFELLEFGTAEQIITWWQEIGRGSPEDTNFMKSFHRKPEQRKLDFQEYMAGEKEHDTDWHAERNHLEGILRSHGFDGPVTEEQIKEFELHAVVDELTAVVVGGEE